MGFLIKTYIHREGFAQVRLPPCLHLCYARTVVTPYSCIERLRGLVTVSSPDPMREGINTPLAFEVPAPKVLSRQHAGMARVGHVGLMVSSRQSAGSHNPHPPPTTHPPSAATAHTHHAL